MVELLLHRVRVSGYPRFGFFKKLFMNEFGIDVAVYSDELIARGGQSTMVSLEFVGSESFDQVT